MWSGESASPPPSPAGVPGLVAGRRGAPPGRGPAAGRHAQHPGGGGGAGAGLPRHQVSVPPARPRRRRAEVSLGFGIRPCVSCLWGEGGRRACLTVVSCWNQGVINTISLLRLPPPRSLPPPAGLKNKQAQEAQGRGAARGRLAAGRAGPAGEPRGTGGHAWAHGHTHCRRGRRAFRSWWTTSFLCGPL